MIDQDQDISKLKIVEDKLTKVFRKKVIYEHVLNGLPHLIIITDELLNIIWANKAAVEKWGDIVGKKYYKLYNDPDSEFSEDIVRRVLENEETLELERSITFPNGTQGDFIVTSSLLKDLTGNVVAVLRIFTDISERKQAEENLKKSELHFRTLIDNISEIITVLDSKGKINYQSSSIELVLGYSIEEILKKSFFDFMHPDDLPWIHKVFQDIIKKPGASRTLEYRFQHKNGSWRVLESTGRTSIDDLGSISVIVTSRDVTERNKALEALLESEEKFRRIVENTRDCIMLTQPNAVVSYLSPACREVLGYDPQDIVDTVPWLVHSDDTNKVKDTLTQAVPLSPCKA